MMSLAFDTGRPLLHFPTSRTDASIVFFLEEFHGLRIQDTGADPHTATKPPTRTLAPPRHRPRPPRSTQTQQPHTPRVSTPGNSSRCLVGRGTRVGPKVRLQAAPLYVSSTLGAGRRPWVGVGCLPQAAPDSSVRQTPQRYSRLAAGALHKRPDSCKGRRTRHIGRAALSDASARRARARKRAPPINRTTRTRRAPPRRRRRARARTTHHASRPAECGSRSRERDLSPALTSGHAEAE